MLYCISILRKSNMLYISTCNLSFHYRLLSVEFRWFMGLWWGSHPCCILCLRLTSVLTYSYVRYCNREHSVSDILEWKQKRHRKKIESGVWSLESRAWGIMNTLSLTISEWNPNTEADRTQMNSIPQTKALSSYLVVFASFLSSCYLWVAPSHL